MDVFKGFSLYDILSMIIPGGILLWILSDYIPEPKTIANVISIGNNSASSFFFLCPFAYIIGILNHIIASKLWRYFRNNPYLLVKCLDEEINLLGHPQTLSDIRNMVHISAYKEKAFEDFVDFSFLTAIGIVTLGMIIDIIFQTHVNNYAFMAIAITYTIIWGLVTMIGNDTDDKSMSSIIVPYYKAYYLHLQESKNSDINVLEGQVAFLQSMTIPLALLLVSHNDRITTDYSIVRGMILVIYVAIFPVVYNRLVKIHSLVWEAYEFLYIKSTHKE